MRVDPSLMLPSLRLARLPRTRLVSFTAAAPIAPAIRNPQAPPPTATTMATNDSAPAPKPTPGTAEKVDTEPGDRTPCMGGRDL